MNATVASEKAWIVWPIASVLPPRAPRPPAMAAADCPRHARASIMATCDGSTERVRATAATTLTAAITICMKNGVRVSSLA